MYITSRTRKIIPESRESPESAVHQQNPVHTYKRKHMATYWAATFGRRPSDIDKTVSVQPGAPFTNMDQLIKYIQVITYSGRYGIKFLIRSKTSMVQPLKFWDG